MNTATVPTLPTMFGNALQQTYDDQVARANKIAAREPSVIPRHALVDAIDSINDEAAHDFQHGRTSDALVRTEVARRLQVLLD